MTRDFTWATGEYERADQEGWFVLTYTGDIRRNPTGRGFPEIFASHEEARAFVAQRASEGSELHERALAHHVANLLTKKDA